MSAQPNSPVAPFRAPAAHTNVCQPHDASHPPHGGRFLALPALEGQIERGFNSASPLTRLRRARRFRVSATYSLRNLARVAMNGARLFHALNYSANNAAERFPIILATRKHQNFAHNRLSLHAASKAAERRKCRGRQTTEKFREAA